MILMILEEIREIKEVLKEIRDMIKKEIESEE